MDNCAVISWTGQMQYLPNGEPVILTTYVVAHQTNPEDNWRSSVIGTNTFHAINYAPAECWGAAAAYIMKGDGK